ncbi:MAG: hypothetical protein U9R49_00640 [Bacteroidota bacterium]|nr:hypothetical protein [Bacteroidota bacterium]
MKRIISIIGIVTLFISLISISCTNPVNEVEVPKKTENTLQSVSYLTDSIGHDPQQILEAFIKLNEVIDSIGYPDAGYKLWLIQEDSSEVRFMLEGLWPNQAIYDEIHNHQLYTDAWENFDFDWEGMTRYEYHRFTLIK